MSTESFLAGSGARARRLLGVPMNVARILPGFARYLATGTTSPRAYGAMRRLFCLTNGRSNDLLSGLVRVVRPAYRLDRSDGVLGDMQGQALADVLGALDRDGFYVFDRRLPETTCDAIEAFARRCPCRRRTTVPTEPGVFDPATAGAGVFDFKSSDLLGCSAIRELLVDRSMIAVAQGYIRSRVVLDTPTMWWSAAGEATPSSLGAQLYHFDMDRVKFLKFFAYITDVNSDNGPHCYVRGSHQRKPSALLTDGRKSDEEIAEHYGDRSVEICGPRGTIFAADTRGFHKGKLLHQGIRLVYEMEFANLMFGQTYPPVLIQPDRDAEVAEIKRLYPATYSNFHVGSA